MQQSINNDPIFLESTGLSSTSGMTSNDNLPPLESTSKANLQPKMSTAKGLYETLFNTKSSKMQPFRNQFNSPQTSEWLPTLNSTSKGYFKPKMSTFKSPNEIFGKYHILDSCSNDPTYFRYICQIKQNKISVGILLSPLFNNFGTWSAFVVTTCW